MLEVIVLVVVANVEGFFRDERGNVFVRLLVSYRRSIWLSRLCAGGRHVAESCSKKLSWEGVVYFTGTVLENSPLGRS